MEIPLNETVNHLHELNTVFTPEHMFHTITDKTHKNLFTDTGRFIFRIVLLLYGVDALEETWETLQTVASEDNFYDWLWLFLCETSLILLPMPGMEINNDRQVRNMSLIKTFLNGDNICIFDKEPELYFIVLRVQTALFLHCKE